MRRVTHVLVRRALLACALCLSVAVAGVEAQVRRAPRADAGPAACRRPSCSACSMPTC